MPSEPDEWLMAQVADGKRSCLEVLVRRYATPLLSFIGRMVGDRHQSEELFQEVFLAVWTKRHQYQFPRPFKAWIYAIALNQCRAAFRSPAPQALSLDQYPSAAVFARDPSPVEKVVGTETASLVSAAVARLPARQRAVIVLRVWQGMSYAEIAEVVGRKEATVRAHMHHGLAAMRKYLEPRLG
jgi:RNA polymerase sigma-70 factor (ECF subfamily)